LFDKAVINEGLACVKKGRNSGKMDKDETTFERKRSFSNIDRDEKGIQVIPKTVPNQQG
jgi:hypothetical protein